MVGACSLVVAALGAPAAVPDAPVGHMKPLGAHLPPSPGVPVEIGFPPAEEFFRKYARPKQPVIMRGACDGWPAREKWTDEYFRGAMGSRSVEL